jgi:hypothetical protein
VLDVTVAPTAEVLESLGQVPVVEGHVRRDACLVQPVEEATIEVDAGLVDRARAVRQDAGPGDREPVGVDSEILEQLHVLEDSMVVVGAAVAGNVPEDVARSLAERIPDGWSSAALVPCPLDLIGAGRHPELEPVRQIESGAVTAGRRSSLSHVIDPVVACMRRPFRSP